MIGININDTTQDFTGQILADKKTIETRTHRRLDQFVNTRIAIIRTGKGKAMVVGYATLGEPIVYKTRREFESDVNLHQIKRSNKKFKWNGKTRYGYPLLNIEKCQPFEPKVTKEYISHKEFEINENKIMLKEDRQTNYQIQKIIRELYKVTQKHNKFYSDDAWDAVNDLENDFYSVPMVSNVVRWAGQYHNYLDGSNDAPYRTYKILIETEFGINIGGEITCSAAGTMKDPFSRYDICCSFWRDHDDDYLNESKLRKIIRHTLMEVTMNGHIDPEEKEYQMNQDWADIDSYGTDFPTDGAYNLGDKPYGNKDMDTDNILDDMPEVNSNVYDDPDYDGDMSMRAMDSFFRNKKDNERYPSIVKDSGRSARREPIGSENTFDDEIEKYGLNMEKSKLNETKLRKIVRNVLKEMTQDEYEQGIKDYVAKQKKKCEIIGNALKAKNIDFEIVYDDGYSVEVSNVYNKHAGYEAERIANNVIDGYVSVTHYPALTRIIP